MGGHIFSAADPGGRLMSVLGAGVPSAAGFHQVYLPPETPNAQNLTLLINSISATLATAENSIDVTQLTDAANRSVVRPAEVFKRSYRRTRAPTI